MVRHTGASVQTQVGRVLYTSGVTGMQGFSEPRVAQQSTKKTVVVATQVRDDVAL